MSNKQCFFCNGFHGKKLPHGATRVEISELWGCPVINPKAKEGWERGYSDALDGKDKKPKERLDYHYGYNRGSMELEKVRA